MQLLTYMYKQVNDWTCGPAVARLVLHFHFGQRRSIQGIIRRLRITRSGTANSQLTRLLRAYGIPYRTKYPATLADIKRSIHSNLVVLAYWIPRHKESHYSVVKKVDSRRIYFHDTWFGSGHSYSIAYFQRYCWKDKDYRWLLLIHK